MDESFPGQKMCTFGDSIIDKKTGEEIPTDKVLTTPFEYCSK